MKFMGFNLSLLRPVRTILTVCVCALLVFASVTPAFAAGSSLGKGEENLTSIEKKAQEKAMQNPLSREETQAEANKGLNEVQGAADADKMYNPGNTGGGDTVEANVKKVLEKVTDSDS